MTPLNLGLGPECVVKGAIYDTLDQVYLIEDLLEVDLPSGETISVEWDSHSGPRGRFVIVAFRDYWENRIRTEFADTPMDAVNRLRSLRLQIWSDANLRTSEMGSDDNWTPTTETYVNA